MYACHFFVLTGSKNYSDSLDSYEAIALMHGAGFKDRVVLKTRYQRKHE
jgi:hypothetical protein